MTKKKNKIEINEDSPVKVTESEFFKKAHAKAEELQRLFEDNGDEGMVLITLVIKAKNEETGDMGHSTRALMAGDDIDGTELMLLTTESLNTLRRAAMEAGYLVE